MDFPFVFILSEDFKFDKCTCIVTRLFSSFAAFLLTCTEH